MPPGHAGLLPRGGAGPQPLWSGRPRQAAAAAPLPGLDPELRAAAGHGASAAAGPGPGPAREAVRRRQPGVPVSWPLRPAPGSARREAPASGRGLRTRSPTTWRGSSPAPAAAWAVASTPAPTGASCGGRSWGPTATPTGSTCAARRTSSACSTRSPRPARRSFPMRRTSSTTSRAPRTRRRTAAPWSTSGSSPPSPMSTA